MMSMLSVGILSATAAEDENPVDVAADESESDNSEKASTGIEFTPYWISGYGSVVETTDYDSNLLKSLAYEKFFDVDDYVFFPMAIIAKIPGTKGDIVVYLCESTVSTKKRERDTLGMSSYEEGVYTLLSRWWTLFTVYINKDGNNSNKLLHYSVIDPENVKTLDKTPESGNSPWIITDGNGECSDELINATIKEYKDMKLSFIAVIGEMMYGNKYRILCYGTTTSEIPMTDLYLVDMEKTDEKAVITNVSFFDLSAYVGSLPEDNNTENQSNNDSGSTNTDKPDDSDDTADNTSTSNTSNTTKTSTASNTTTTTTTGSSSGSSTSPKTGQSETVAFIMLGVILMSAGVIWFVRKRERA